MTANYQQALATQRQADRIIKDLTGLRPTAIAVVPKGRGWAVRVGLSHKPTAQLPKTVEGVPLLVELIGGTGVL